MKPIRELVLLGFFVLSACGGGSGSDTRKPSDLAPIQTPAPVQTTVTGVPNVSVEVDKDFVVLGTNLDHVSSFQINSVQLRVVNVSATQVTLHMPSTAVSGPLMLTVDGAQTNTGYQLNAYVAAAVTGFSPAAGLVGSAVNVSGQGLNSVTSVLFSNGIVAQVQTPHTDTSLSFLVPAGAVSGNLVLVGTYNKATTATAYTVIPTVTISSMSSSAGGTSMTVTVLGSDLKWVTAAAVGSVNGAIVSATDTQLIFTVPLGSNGAVTLSATNQPVINVGTIAPPTAAQRFSINGVDFSQIFDRSENDPALVLTSGKPVAVRAAVVSASAGQPSPVVLLTATSKAGAVLGNVAMSGPATLSTQVDGNALNATFNAVLPAAWVQPGLQINVTAASSDGSQVQTHQAAPKVGQPTKIHIVMVPLKTTSQTAVLPDSAIVRQGFTRTYPYAAGDITVTQRAPLVLNEAVLNWGNALDQLESVRAQEDPKAFYYGFVPYPQSGGTAGLGYVGDRTNGTGATSAIGYDTAYSDTTTADSFGIVWQEWLITMLHELGHNHSLEHTPCGDPSSPDPAYPYPNADFGPYAVYNSLYRDTQLGQLGAPLFSKGDSSTSQKMKDVMSYCDGAWMSDFSYVRAQQFALARTAQYPQLRMAAAAREAAPIGYLTISGQIDPSGVTLRPALASGSRLRPAVPGSQHDYSLRIRTAQGLSFDLPFEVVPVADGAPGTSHFWVSFANPGDIAAIDVLHKGTVMRQAARRVVSSLAASQSGAAGPSFDWKLAGGRLAFTWNAHKEPFASVLYVAANGVNTVLATALTGGSASLDVSALPRGGRFEVSLSSSTQARMVSMPN